MRFIGSVLLIAISNTVEPRTMLILGKRKISVLQKQCTMGYHIGTSKNRVSVKFLHTVYTTKSVQIKFSELIKNRVFAKSVLREAVQNEALLYVQTFNYGLAYFFNKVHITNHRCGMQNQIVPIVTETNLHTFCYKLRLMPDNEFNSHQEKAACYCEIFKSKS